MRNQVIFMVVLTKLYFWFIYDLGQKYYALQVWPNWGLYSWPPDHDNTLHVTEKPALTTRPSVTSVIWSNLGVWVLCCLPGLRKDIRRQIRQVILTSSYLLLHIIITFTTTFSYLFRLLIFYTFLHIGWQLIWDPGNIVHSLTPWKGSGNKAWAVLLPNVGCGDEPVASGKVGWVGGLGGCSSSTAKLLTYRITTEDELFNS